MTGNSLICVQHKLGADVIVRPLVGVECMGLIGWDAKFWAPGTFLPTDPKCASLAGNAFSGFAVLPVLAVAFAGMELLIEALEEKRAEVERNKVPQTQTGSESSSG